MGTALMGIMTQMTGSANAGVAVLSLMFVIGFFIFGKAAALNRNVA